MCPPRVASRAFLVALFVLGMRPGVALATWPHDPSNGTLALSTALGDQVAPSTIPDGSGGAFVAWHGSPANDIYVQHVSAAGVPLWTTNGVVVCSAVGGQVFPTLASDGAGGVILTWYDARNSGQNDIYAQRVNAAGIPQWTTDGVAICTLAGDQSNPQIVSDGAGGAIITWQDFRSLTTYDVYAQRVNGSGAVQWTGNGVVLSASANDQTLPVIVADGAGGAIVIWQDQRAGVGVYDIYGQRVNAAGAAQWTGNGIGFCVATANQLVPRIVPDGVGGAISTWYDQRNGNSDIFAQHTTAAGTMLWNGNGVPLCTATNEQNFPAITADGSGGAIVAWADYRNGGVSDVYAQRVNASGTTLWTANGVALCGAANAQSSVCITSDGAQGAIVGWQDFRGFNADIFAQRVSAAGVPLWTTDGVAVCTALGLQLSASIASDGAGGAILAWQDQRNGVDADIYGERIERFGQLGNPEPAIVNVRDVPVDQGGKVSLEWNASYIDGDPWNLVANYWIWRQAPRSLAVAALARGARLEGDGATPATSPEGLWKITIDGAQTLFWEYVGSQAAQGFPGYSYVAPTTGDSIGGANPLTLFMVEAKSSGTAFWNSAPDSGYSVDNIAPATPVPFTGQYSSGSSTLHWGRNSEADFAEYRLYRGTTSSFVPAPANLVAAQPDTGYVDAAGAPYFYKLAALDVHGNPSGYALLLPDGTVDVAEGGLPGRLDLALLGGNPVREGAEFRFALPTSGPVALSLFDQQGRRVRDLARGFFPAGEHRASWDGRDAAGERVPSGIYFCRLEAGQRTMSRKLAVVR
jgi:hypothetical protein